MVLMLHAISCAPFSQDGPHETRSEHYAEGFPDCIAAFASFSDPRTGSI